MRGVWAWPVLVVACAGLGEGQEVEGQVEERAVVTDAPAHAAPERLATTGAVRALLATDGGLLVGTDAGLFRLRGSDALVELVPMPLSDADPPACGAIRSLAPRPAGGALVAAEQGLYTWDGQRLARSPASGLVPSPVSVASGGAGAAELVAAVDGAGRVWSLGEAARRLEFGAPARAVAIATGSLFAGLSNALVRLEATPDGWGVASAVDEAAGVLALQAGAGGALWAVTPGAVLRRESDGARARWTRWRGAYAGAVAGDPDGFGAWVAVADGAVRLGPDRATHVRLGFTPTSLALDATGALWAGEPGTHALWRGDGLGAPPPSFAAEVAPFARARCLACHAAGTSLPLDTHARWTANALRILVSLRARAMPAGAPLEPAQYRVVERWVEGGMLP